MTHIIHVIYCPYASRRTFNLPLPLVNRYCIPNAVEDTTANRVLRLNLNGHPLSYVNDQDMGTSWLSRTMTTREDLEDGLTITLDLANGQYQVTVEPTTLYIIWTFFEPGWNPFNF